MTAQLALFDTGTQQAVFSPLLDQAIILQSEPLDDPSAFARRMSEIMLKALKEK